MPLVRWAVLGVVIRGAEVERLVGLMLEMVSPVVMVAAMEAVVEHHITATQLAAPLEMEERLAAEVAAEARRMEGLLVPQAVMAAMEPSESIVGR